MSELVKRLRDMNGGWASDEALAAADRIEELEAENADLKDKLAKAVEKLLGAAEQLDGYVRYGYGDEFREVIAELTGGNDE